jgi:two-component system CheB/CheR fusion protein
VEDSFYSLIKFIEKKTAFHLQSYKERPLARRLKARMRLLGLETYGDYHSYLINHEGEFTLLKDALTINLSYFFRNPETFECVRQLIVSEFGARNGLVFWSAGCAQGEEAYSLAIIAAEVRMRDRVKIYGTDIDDGVLAKARIGKFPASSFQYMAPDIRRKYFEEEGQYYAIDGSLRSLVDFKHLDLFEKPDFGLCDIIMCRNVLIYLDRKGQSTVLRNFYDRLRDDGFLVIGKVELLIGIPEAQLFTVVSRTEHVYKKKMDGRD